MVIKCRNSPGLISSMASADFALAVGILYPRVGWKSTTALSRNILSISGGDASPRWSYQKAVSITIAWIRDRGTARSTFWSGCSFGGLLVTVSVTGAATGEGSYPAVKSMINELAT